MSEGTHHAVRQARMEDLPTVVAIAAGSPTAPQWKLAEYRDIVQPAAAGGLVRILLVAERPDGEVAGFAVLMMLRTVFPPDAELESLAVHPVWRGHGLGAALLRAVEHRAAAAGAERLLLEVRAGNAPALHLYRAAGFQRTGLRPGYYAFPTEDAVCMALILS